MAEVRRAAECREIDAGGAVVIPGFVDCHTHAVFADYRLDEYEKRIQGVPYAEIAKAGGGIAKSVSDLRKTYAGPPFGAGPRARRRAASALDPQL